MRQQLREWCCEAVAKRGDQRQPLAVEAGVAPLLRWVWHWWQGPQLTLALEASTLGDRFVVLAISMHYRGCALPVAWAVLPATATGAWKAEWGRPRQHLQATVPDPCEEGWPPYGPRTAGGRGGPAPGPFPAGKGSPRGHWSWLVPREDAPPDERLRRPKSKDNWGVVDRCTEKPTPVGAIGGAGASPGLCYTIALRAGRPLYGRGWPATVGLKSSCFPR